MTTNSDMLCPYPPVLLRLGNARPVSQSLSRSPDGAFWMAYFDINSTAFVQHVRESARLTAKRVFSGLGLTKENCVVVAPATSPIAVAHILRSEYGLRTQILWKKRRVSTDESKVLREEYAAATSGTSSTLSVLFFEGFDVEIEFDAARDHVVFFDNVATTGETLAASARLLRRAFKNLKIVEAIVMYTEGEHAFERIRVAENEWLPVHAFGGHIPTYPAAQIVSMSAVPSLELQNQGTPLPGREEVLRLNPPTKFVFKSSARFPTHFNPQKNVLFATFETSDGRNSAVALVGPETFDTVDANKSVASSASRPEEPDYRAQFDSETHLWEGVTVRVHDACLTSECFHSTKCDCREQLEQALQLVCTRGGMVIYLFQEGRGIGIGNKIKAYFFQQMALHDTVEANRALGLPDDAREYIAVRDILRHFKVGSVRLMTNNPRKIESLQELGVRVLCRVPAEVVVTAPGAAKYLHDKQVAMGHFLKPETYTGAWKPGAEYAMQGDGGVLQDSQAAASAAPSVVRFYEPGDANGFLSNFYPSQIRVGDATYATVEHYYQSRKFASQGIAVSTEPPGRAAEREAVRAAVASAPSPDDAFALSRKHVELVRPDWEALRKRDMFRGLIHKFKQHPSLRKRLIATGDAPIVENSNVDSYWGCGPTGTGRNVLGQMLMNIRAAAKEHVFDVDSPLE